MNHFDEYWPVYVCLAMIAIFVLAYGIWECHTSKDISDEDQET